MKYFLFLLMFFTTSCLGHKPDVFVTEYNLSPTVTFDFTKSASVEVGTVTFLNKENKNKKWRYIFNAPLGCLYNRKTKECEPQGGMPLVSNNPDPEKLDSAFWALLGSATSHTPVKPYGSTQATVFLNLNFHPRPEEIIQNVRNNHRDLEYRIFIRTGSVTSPDTSGTPDFVIRTIKVID